ncbi:hypothetical protein L873DRAFT_1819434 [Choiromyces venosus 120613-1]|uniref:Uncharacterized protein n=1 Tax=Choiromyces venosus 120613-1 TaxID=1336337 RepID=A0A3N4J4V3_9PEZI|nr:hypothetical protein L873DRAFT_1819434 [Choiromyces venosus 120613-1]
MSVNILVGASQTCPSDWATMSHSDITRQSSNFMPDNTNGDSGGGSGGSGGDTTIILSGSAADLTNKLRINTSKMREDERSAARQVVGMAPGMMLAGDNQDWRRIP